MSIQLKRATRLFVSTVDKGFSKENTKEVLIQDDFAFNQEASYTDITVNEAGPRPIRGSQRFTDALNAADWNFSTYILPYVDSTGKVMVPDYFMWHALSSYKEIDLAGEHGVHTNETNMVVDFKDSNAHELLMLQLYFLVDNVWYHIKDCQVGQAEVSVDIENIGMTAWSGQGRLIRLLDTQPFDPKEIGITDLEYAALQESYLVNKLTAFKLKDNKTKKEYDIAITGGSFTINNNITYLTPEVMSRVNYAIGSFTGTLEISGSVTAYLNDKSLGTVDLYNDLLASLQSVTDFELALVLGGEYATDRHGAILVAKHAHITPPSIETDDVLGTTIEFRAIPTELDARDDGYLGFSTKFNTTTIKDFIDKGDAHKEVDPGTGG